MPQTPEDTTGSLERARKRLYEQDGAKENRRQSISSSRESSTPHAWAEKPLPRPVHSGARHVRFAGIFFAAALSFFLISFAVAAYFFYFGNNSVSTDKISIEIQGPTTIAGGDTVPISLAITNRNSVTIENATIEIEFPNGTRSATDILKEYPRYTENIGPIMSGETVTRSIQAVVFGSAGQSLSLPISLSYGAAGSNSTFVKETEYVLAISSTPISLSVNSLSETVSGKPLTIVLSVRSNATVPLNNVVLTSALPFGFTVTSSSIPFANPSFYIGTLAPGTSKEITLSGILSGQDKEQRVFRFTVGTGTDKDERTLAISYMEQDATVTIVAPFIYTTLALNGNTSVNAVTPGSRQSVTVSYRNTLSTGIDNASVSIALSGSAIDYDSIETSNGFYRSADRTIVFSRDTDPSLASIAPGASGRGSFTFAVLPAGMLAPAPTITFSTSVSGTRVGQTSVPEEVRSSTAKTVKVSTAVLLSSFALHSSGPLSNSGPLPPRADQATTYAIVWDVKNTGNAVAGGVVSAVIPNYVSYTGLTSGSGSFSYDEKSRTVTWKVGDLSQVGIAQGIFQVSLIPSVSQKGTAPPLVGDTSFSGYDRFAGVQITASADSATTETRGDPGYIQTNSIVQ